MKITNKSTEKHIAHKIITKRAKPKSPHYGYYHCETCNKFISWIPKFVYYQESKEQKREEVMWFGKYQGVKLVDLPQDYLEWAILNIDKGINKLLNEYERRENLRNKKT